MGRETILFKGKYLQDVNFRRQNRSIFLHFLVYERKRSGPSDVSFLCRAMLIPCSFMPSTIVIK